MGLDAIELPASAYGQSPHCPTADLMGSKAKRDQWLAAIDKRGLIISSLSAHGNPIHPDPDAAKLSHDRLRTAILLAEKLGVDRVNAFSGCPGDQGDAKVPNWVTCPWPPEFAELVEWQWDKKVIPYWSKQAKFATFYLASVNFKLGDYEQAEGYYQKFLDKYYIDENFEAAAKCGIAGCRESMRDFEAAGRIYLEVAENYPHYAQHIEALYKATLNLARAGMKEEALGAFELLKEIPDARNQTKNARVFLYEKKILDPYTYDIN